MVDVPWFLPQFLHMWEVHFYRVIPPKKLGKFGHLLSGMNHQVVIPISDGAKGIVTMLISGTLL
jgi:hypothetical protein